MNINVNYNPQYISDVPKYATEGSAGIDLRADIEKVLICNPFELVEIPTGLKVAIPAGHCGFISVRSSIAKRGLIAANGIGVIECDYRGELVLILRNISLQPVAIQPNERVAQLVILPYVVGELQYLTSPEFAKHETVRGSGGFGSTGVF